MTKLILGFFDGIHKGHQEVIKNVYSPDSYLITFDTSPKLFFKNENNSLLTTNNEKVEILKKIFPDLKVEFLIFKNICDLSPEQFIKYLKNLFDFKVISVGYDFKFGKNAEGNVNTLRKLSKKYNFELVVQKKVLYKNRAIHSSLIRNYLINYPSRMQDVVNMLGRFYQISGIVIEGKKIGRKIGFPTANILVPPYKVIPYFGIYKAEVRILNNDFKDRIFDGLLYIGPRPVINNYEISVEVWIKDFNHEIYYQPVVVDIIKFIRKVKSFKNLNTMVKQIEKDIEIAFVD